MNTRVRLIIFLSLSLLAIGAIALSPLYLDPDLLSIQPGARNQPPSGAHWMGTDYMGRDVFYRTIAGLNSSLRGALLASLIGAVIGTGIGVFSAALNNVIGQALGFLIDIFMSLPHLIFGVVICLACGGGTTGVVAAVAVTHWACLARIARTETRQILAQPYIQLSRNFGKSPVEIAFRHVIPGVVKQSLVYSVLLFPHAILHESGFSFIGVGLSPHLPSIGVMLSDAVKYLPSGYWWVGVFPGLALVAMVLLIDQIGDAVKRLCDARTSQL